MRQEARIRRKLERIREHRRKSEEKKASRVLVINQKRIPINISPSQEA